MLEMLTNYLSMTTGLGLTIFWVATILIAMAIMGILLLILWIKEIIYFAKKKKWGWFALTILGGFSGIFFVISTIAYVYHRFRKK